ncbi:MAG TPA: preprotein translocase subunit SecA, partial [Alcanivorax sp.]|nr:preprotein translocase subunit SecA [Alcanivorax sp.]HBP68458.1 preprotein translocase subunit SecA [Alcanivorax sp.]HBS15642.1 preprotein translocase subunit SecA [Alcanivorax sp.]
LVRVLHNFEVRREDEVERLEAQRQEEARVQAEKMKAEQEEVAAPTAQGDGTGQTQGPPEKPRTVVREGRKVGRNEPCPCGSGKKYKQCHGKLD